jgi:hypothetical protein
VRPPSHHARSVNRGRFKATRHYVRRVATDEDRRHLATWWRTFAEQECRGYSPLYERICLAVAADDDILDLACAAPPFGRQPNVLLAVVHDLVLRGVDHPLREVYERAGAGEAVADDADARFCDLVHQHVDEVARQLSFRRTNTNECGRSAVLAPALRWAADQIGEPVALLDAGASAGLNLHLDRYLLDYGDTGMTGPPDAAVRIACTVEGSPPIAARAPSIIDRIGLDRAPVDLEDPAEVRWLLACVWPDTGRLARTAAAIEVARAHPVTILEGDLVDGLDDAVGRLVPDVPLVVTTTWVLAYLPRVDRERFIGALRELGRDRPVVWIVAEAPGVVPGFDVETNPADGDVRHSILGGAVFRDGRGDLSILGRCHAHGSTLRWGSG